MRRGATRPWRGTVINSKTKQPIDLSAVNVELELTVLAKETDETPLVHKTFGVDAGPGGITVGDDGDEGVYTVSWDTDDTADVTEELLHVIVRVKEPDGTIDFPWTGLLALSG